MSQPSRKVEIAVWGTLSAIVFLIMVAYIMAALRGKPLPVYGTVPDFTLTNQDGRTVTLADFRGKIWVADAIFTRCPGQCLLMSAHMTELEHAPGPPLQLVSFTTDPAFDQPAVLKKYGDRFGALDNRWTFLTGDKGVLHSVEVDGLRLPVLDKPAGQQESANDLFIHSEKFVLIDKLGRIRGYFDGQDKSVGTQVVGAAQALAGE